MLEYGGTLENSFKYRLGQQVSKGKLANIVGKMCLKLAQCPLNAINGLLSASQQCSPTTTDIAAEMFFRFCRAYGQGLVQDSYPSGIQNQTRFRMVVGSGW